MIGTEQSRLAGLRSYHLLDTPAEEAFDDIVRLAVQFCETPVGLVSLIDENRQWFKARVGFGPCETPLSQSVCAHSLNQPDSLLIIPDLTADARTRGNTLVTGEPFIRFYAGAVLKSPTGEALGTLCVIDDKPRPEGLSAPQAAALEALARQIVSQMELRKMVVQRDMSLLALDDVRRDLMISEERYRLSGIATSTVIWDWDRRKRVIHWGEGLSRVFGYQAALIENTRDWWLEQIHPGDRDQVAEVTRAAIESSEGHWTSEYRFRRGDDSYATVLNQGIIVRDRRKRAIRMTGVMLDISDRAAADEQQNIINQELSHRLKNTLAMVQAIAAQTLRNAPSLDEARQALSERLVALGRAHDLLLVGKAERAGMEAIIRGALSIHADGNEHRLRISGPPIEVGARAALALALMMHELGTNAIKYGALSVPGGHVTVDWSLNEGSEPPLLDLVWAEHDGPPVSPPRRRGFGTRMIERALAGTIGSTVKLSYERSGARCEFKTPLKAFEEGE